MKKLTRRRDHPSPSPSSSTGGPPSLAAPTSTSTPTTPLTAPPSASASTDANPSPSGTYHRPVLPLHLPSSSLLSGAQDAYLPSGPTTSRSAAAATGLSAYERFKRKDYSDICVLPGRTPTPASPSYSLPQTPSFALSPTSLNGDDVRTAKQAQAQASPPSDPPTPSPSTPSSSSSSVAHRQPVLTFITRTQAPAHHVAVMPPDHRHAPPPVPVLPAPPSAPVPARAPAPAPAPSPAPSPGPATNANGSPASRTTLPPPASTSTSTPPSHTSYSSSYQPHAHAHRPRSPGPSSANASTPSSSPSPNLGAKKHHHHPTFGKGDLPPSAPHNSASRLASHPHPPGHGVVHGESAGTSRASDANAAAALPTTPLTPSAMPSTPMKQYTSGLPLMTPAAHKSMAATPGDLPATPVSEAGRGLGMSIPTKSSPPSSVQTQSQSSPAREDVVVVDADHKPPSPPESFVDSPSSPPFDRPPPSASASTSVSVSPAAGREPRPRPDLVRDLPTPPSSVVGHSRASDHTRSSDGSALGEEEEAEAEVEVEVVEEAVKGEEKENAKQSLEVPKAAETTPSPPPGPVVFRILFHPSPNVRRFSLVDLVESLDLSDVKNLRETASAPRALLSDGEGKELVLERFLGSLGYRCWPKPSPVSNAPSSSPTRGRDAAQDEEKTNQCDDQDPLPLSISDMDAFLLFHDLLPEYHLVALQILQAAHHPRDVDPRMGRIARITTRAYNRFYHRLRIQPPGLGPTIWQLIERRRQTDNLGFRTPDSAAAAAAASVYPRRRDPSPSAGKNGRSRSAVNVHRPHRDPSSSHDHPHPSGPPVSSSAKIAAQARAAAAAAAAATAVFNEERGRGDASSRWGSASEGDVRGASGRIDKRYQTADLKRVNSYYHLPNAHPSHHDRTHPQGPPRSASNVDLRSMGGGAERKHHRRHSSQDLPPPLPTGPSPSSSSFSSTAIHPGITSPYRPGRAALLRVWVPATRGNWMTDEEIVSCEQELFRSGVWPFLRRGDVVSNLAMNDERNNGKLVFDGRFLRDLDFAFDPIGHLPDWLNLLAFPPSYFHNIVRSSKPTPVVYLNVEPWRDSIVSNLRLVQDYVETTSPQGRYRIAKWVYRSQMTLREGALISNEGGKGGKGPGGIEVLDDAWVGKLVIETDGTSEHAKELLTRCMAAEPSPHLASLLGPTSTSPSGAPLPPLNHLSAANGLGGGGGGGKGRKDAGGQLTPWWILRDRSRPGEIWLRPVEQKERCG